MKKALVIILAVLMAACCFAACKKETAAKKDDSPVGTYHLKTMNGMSALDYLKDQLDGDYLEYALQIAGLTEDEAAAGKFVTAVIKEDGTANLTAPLAHINMDFNWKQEGNKVIFEVKGYEEKIEMVYANGELSGEYNGESAVLVKE